MDAKAWTPRAPAEPAVRGKLRLGEHGAAVLEDAAQPAHRVEHLSPVRLAGVNSRVTTFGSYP
jgi:hypothetical protein